MVTLHEKGYQDARESATVSDKVSEEHCPPNLQ